MFRFFDGLSILSGLKGVVVWVRCTGVAQDLLATEDALINQRSARPVANEFVHDEHAKRKAYDHLPTIRPEPTEGQLVGMPMNLSPLKDLYPLTETGRTEIGPSLLAVRQAFDHGPSAGTGRTEKGAVSMSVQQTDDFEHLIVSGRMARSAGRKRFKEYMAVALATLLTTPAIAKEGDTFRPFVSYARYFDSNLYRLAESEYSLLPKRSDQYGVLSAGLNVDWKPGRQQILASANKTQVRYSRNAQLDYDGSDYSLKWNWRVGNYWSGQVGTTETVTQSSFEDLGTQINNQVTSDNRFVSAQWQIHPRFSAELGASEAVVKNSTVQQKPLDYEAKSASATLIYSTPKGSNLRGQVLRVNGEYLNRVASFIIDRAYTQTEYNLFGDWGFSGKLIPHAKIGYIQRENDTVSQRNFSGFVGRLSVDFYPTGKTALNWAVYRELANSDDINASYQINTGISLGTAWRVTSKTSLRANGTYENRNFQGDTGFAFPGLVKRNEDTLSGSLSLSYAPVRPVTIDLGLQAGRRDSNYSANDYSFNMFYVSLRADF